MEQQVTKENKVTQAKQENSIETDSNTKKETKSQRTRIKKTNSYSELVTKGLSSIPDDFIISKRKDGDNGLKRLVEEYEEYVNRHSIYPEISEDTTAKDLKLTISKMTFEQQIEIIYAFMAGTGKVEEYFDHDKEVKRFRFQFIKISSFIFMFLIVMIIGGVIAAGIIRNDISTNDFLKLFMDLINKITEILITGKPTIE